MSLLVEIPGLPGFSLDAEFARTPELLRSAVCASTGLPSHLIRLPALLPSLPSARNGFCLLRIGLVGAGLLGGKGGFGALLKATSAALGTKKTTNFSACRDLSGRRLRHVEAAKQLLEWEKKPKYSQKEISQMFREAKSNKRKRRQCKFGEKCKYQNTTCRDEHPADRERKAEQYRRTHLSSEFGDPKHPFAQQRPNLAEAVLQGLKAQSSSIAIAPDFPGKRRANGDAEFDEGAEDEEEEEEEAGDDDDLLYFGESWGTRSKGAQRKRAKLALAGAVDIVPRGVVRNSDGSNPSEDSDPNAETESEGWECDGCSSARSDNEARYRCLTCDDFDLCASCHRSKPHLGPAGERHELLLISGSGALPITEFLRRLGLDVEDAPDGEEGETEDGPRSGSGNKATAEAEGAPMEEEEKSSDSEPPQTPSSLEAPSTPKLDQTLPAEAASFADSAALLASWGADKVTGALRDLGLKSGGRPEQRAELLFSLSKEFKTVSEVPRKHFSRR